MIEADPSEWPIATPPGAIVIASRDPAGGHRPFDVPSVFSFRGRIGASAFIARCFWLLLADFLLLGAWVTLASPRGLGLWPWGLEAIALPLTWVWACVQVQRLRAVGRGPWILLLGFAPRAVLLVGTLLAGLGLLPDRVPLAMLGVAVASPAPDGSVGALPQLREALQGSALRVANTISYGRETPEQVAVRVERARAALATGGEASREDLDALVGFCTLGVAFGRLSPGDASNLVALANRRLGSMSTAPDEEVRNFYRGLVGQPVEGSLQAPQAERPSLVTAPRSGRAMLRNALVTTVSAHGLMLQGEDDRTRNRGAVGAILVLVLSLLLGTGYRVWLACAQTVEPPTSVIDQPVRGPARGALSLDGHLSRRAFVGRWLLCACVGGLCLSLTFNLGLAYSAEWAWWLGFGALLVWSWLCMQAQRLRDTHRSLAWIAASAAPIAVAIGGLVAGWSTTRSSHATLWLTVSGLTGLVHLTWLCVMPSRGPCTPPALSRHTSLESRT